MQKTTTEYPSAIVIHYCDEEARRFFEVAVGSHRLSVSGAKRRLNFLTDEGGGSPALARLAPADEQRELSVAIKVTHGDPSQEPSYHVPGVLLRDMIAAPFGLCNDYAEYTINKLSREHGPPILKALLRDRDQQELLERATDSVAIARSLLFPKVETRDSPVGGLVCIPLCLLPLFVSHGPVWIRKANDPAAMLSLCRALLSFHIGDSPEELARMERVMAIVRTASVPASTLVDSNSGTPSGTQEEEQDSEPQGCNLSLKRTPSGDQHGNAFPSPPRLAGYGGGGGVQGGESSPSLQQPVIRSVAEIYLPVDPHTVEATLRYFAGRSPETRRVSVAELKHVDGLIHQMILHQNPVGYLECEHLPLTTRNFIYKACKTSSMRLYVRVVAPKGNNTTAASGSPASPSCSPPESPPGSAAKKRQRKGNVSPSTRA